MVPLPAVLCLSIGHRKGQWPYLLRFGSVIPFACARSELRHLLYPWRMRNRRGSSARGVQYNTLEQKLLYLRTSGATGSPTAPSPLGLPASAAAWPNHLSTPRTRLQRLASAARLAPTSRTWVAHPHKQVLLLEKKRFTVPKNSHGAAAGSRPGWLAATLGLPWTQPR